MPTQANGNTVIGTVNPANGRPVRGNDAADALAYATATTNAQPNQFLRYGHETRPGVTGAGMTANAVYWDDHANDVQEVRAGDITVNIPVPPPEEIRYAGHEMRYDPVEEKAVEMLSALAYLLFKKGGIDAGDYQTLTELRDMGYQSLLSHIISVADVPNNVPVTDIDPRD